MSEMPDRSETWQTTTTSTVWVWTRNARIPGTFQKTRVGGKSGGSRTLRITTDERRYNEEQVIDEMADHNPFRNGQLRLVSVDGGLKPDDIIENFHKTDEELLDYFGIDDEALFKEGVSEIHSQLILRRLLVLCERKGSVVQQNVLRDLVEDRYKVGGSQKTFREMEAAGEMSGGVSLSGFNS